MEAKNVLSWPIDLIRRDYASQPSFVAPGVYARGSLAAFHGCEDLFAREAAKETEERGGDTVL